MPGLVLWGGAKRFVVLKMVVRLLAAVVVFVVYSRHPYTYGQGMAAYIYLFR